MAEKDKGISNPEKAQKIGGSLFKWGIIVLLLALVIGRWVGSGEIKNSGPQYSAAYDFSKVKEDFYKTSFKVPAGNKWVSVTFPVGYRAVFTWNTAGALYKGDGKAPIKFGPNENVEFGILPIAVDITAPAGDVMELRLYRHGKSEAQLLAETKRVPKQSANPVIVAGY